MFEGYGGFKIAVTFVETIKSKKLFEQSHLKRNFQRWVCGMKRLNGPEHFQTRKKSFSNKKKMEIGFQFPPFSCFLILVKHIQEKRVA